MRDLLSPFVAERGTAILDGGLATELERRGLDLADPLWSARALLDRPALVELVHRDYLAAGADVITTVTYQATVPGLLARGLTEADAVDLLRAGVTVARRARDAHRPEALVAASIGSYGAFLANGAEYRGGYGLSVDALAGWHRPRARVLEESGADLLAFETIPAREEIEAIVRVLDEADGPPAWISFSARDSVTIADGTPIGEAAALAAVSPRVLAVGVNCVAPELVSPLLRNLRAATDKPLVAYPNRGDVWDAVARGWIVRPAAADYATLAKEWRQLGARIIGGCCGTRPQDVRAIKRGLAPFPVAGNGA
ncbi:MAG TPA: homocysteine S-methyltransferase [Candidatus Bathyarchaeia archaeon]|nr:homocysteine S-methyltransferase [Candidatus Bathyarchaeia archaeon]